MSKQTTVSAIVNPDSEDVWTDEAIARLIGQTVPLNLPDGTQQQTTIRDARRTERGVEATFDVPADLVPVSLVYPVSIHHDTPNG